MISKAKIKYIRSLELKKNRTADGLFVAEGPKVVGDLMPTMHLRYVVATESWLKANQTKIPAEVEVFDVTEEELRKVSYLQTPQEVLAVFELPDSNASSAIEFPKDKLSLALDGVQNPGNLGTIIRIADWFGIENIYCSQDTADAYNPKVVQATMGSIARVNIIYTDITKLLTSLPADYPVYGTLLDGEDIYAKELSKQGIIVMGNEGNGISQEVRKHVNNRLLIPNFATAADKAESLNVAIATAITCSEFRRR